MWTKSRIGNECTVGDGAHTSIKRQTSGILYLSAKNFTFSGLNLKEVSYINLSDFNKYFKTNSTALTKPKAGDLILGIIGAGLGVPYLVDKGLGDFGISSSVALIRKNGDHLSSKYLLFWMKGPFFQSYLKNIQSGSAQGFLSLEMIRSLPLSFPPLPTQKKITSILSAYDELIENNRKRIKLLEEMAEEIYKEWFVRMRFPGYQDATFRDKEGKVVPHGTEGALPEGWEKVKLGQLCEITSSKRIFRSDYVEKGIPFYRGKEIILKSKKETLKTPLFIEESRFKRIKSKFGTPEVGDILITAVGTIGISYLVSELDREFYFKDGNLIWIKKSSKIIPEYLSIYFKTKQAIDKIHSISIGSSQKALTIDSLKNFEIIKPTDTVLKVFKELINPVIHNATVLHRKNQLLQQTRDLLLPRLISGKLDVEKLGIELEEIS